MNQQGKEGRRPVLWPRAIQGACFGLGFGISGLVLPYTLNTEMLPLLFLTGVIMMLLVIITRLLSQEAGSAATGTPMQATLFFLATSFPAGMAIGLLSRSVSPGLSFDLPMVYHFLSVVGGAVLGFLLSLATRTRQVAV